MGGDDSKGITFSLVGDSTQTLQELAADIVPILGRNPKLRDVRVDTGDANTELTVQGEPRARRRLRLQRAAGGPVRRHGSARFCCANSTARNEIPVNVRFAGSDDYGVEDLSTFMVRAPNGPTCRCWRWWTWA